MRTVAIGSTGLTASALGFGCSQMMGRVGRRQSLRALSAAFERGVTYFDVARSYGYGDAESLLGEFLTGKRDRVVVTTKFGIEVPRTTRSRRLLKAMARPVLKRLPALRRAARGTLGSQFSGGHFTVPQMRASLDESLRALRTDHLDVFLLHDCPQEVIAQTDLFDALDRLVQDGKIRCYGMATNWRVIQAGLAALPGRLLVAQLRFSLLEQSPEPLLNSLTPGSHGVIAYSPFGGGGTSMDDLRRGLAELAGQASTPLREKLAKADDRILADAALNAVLSEGHINVVLSAMYDERFVERNVSACERSIFRAEELAQIRQFFRDRQTT